MNKSKESESRLVGVFFRTDKTINLKIKVAACSDGISQQDLINKVLEAYFQKNPVDLSEFFKSA